MRGGLTAGHHKTAAVRIIRAIEAKVRRRKLTLRPVGPAIRGLPPGARRFSCGKYLERDRIMMMMQGGHMMGWMMVGMGVGVLLLLLLLVLGIAALIKYLRS